MTSPFPDAAGPVAGAAWHAGEDQLTGYATGTIEPVAVWSVEAHLTGCARCRSVLSAQVDPQRLARNRSVVLVRAAIGDGGRVRRVLRRCGVPDHVLGLVAATPSLRRSWLLSVVGVLAVVAGEAAADQVRLDRGQRVRAPARYPDPEILAPFLLVAPLLVLAGVAAAFLPMFDPAHRLAVAAPFSGFTLLLARAVSALAAALVPVGGAAFVAAGPRVAARRAAAAVAGVVRVHARGRDRHGPPVAPPSRRGCRGRLAAILLAASHVPLLIVQRQRPVRVRRRALRLGGGGAGPP